MATPTINLRSSGRDLYPKIKDFLLESEDIYPGIDRWWERQVLPGLRSGRRVCHVALDNEDVVAIGIGKHDRNSAKLCTLRVKESHRGQGLGERLLHRTVSDLLERQSRSVYYTISEKVLAECQTFFEPYQFELTHWQRNLYVRGLDELCFSAPAPRIQEAICRVKHAHIGDDVVLLSIKPEYASLIRSGRKLVEFRRSFSARVRNALVLLYETRPVQRIRLACTVVRVEQGSPADLWRQYGDRAGVSKRAFDSYFHGRNRGAALVLDGIRSLTNPIALNDPVFRAAGISVPQSHRFVSSNHPLVQSLFG